jgi:hypothetical protein
VDQKAIVVFLVDHAGVAVPLAEAQHRLACERMLCEFSTCACPPKDRKLSGDLRPSYAQQVEATLTKGKPK